MDKSYVKIISDKKSRALSFYYMNEKGQWRPVPNSSKLSRREITLSHIQESAERILTIIDQSYNINGCGVLICFEGADDDYIYLQKCVKDCFRDKESNFIIQKVIEKNIVVSGMTGTGKTTVIEQMCQWLGGQYKVQHMENFIQYEYFSESSKITWYETLGIEREKDIGSVMGVFNELNGLTDFIYCVSSMHNRLEAIEEDLIINIRKNYPSVKIIILLTLAFRDEDSIIWAERLNKQFEEIPVIPVMAKDVRLRHEFVVESYGLDVVSRYLFGDDAYE